MRKRLGSHIANPSSEVGQRGIIGWAKVLRSPLIQHVQRLSSGRQENEIIYQGSSKRLQREKWFGVTTTRGEGWASVSPWNACASSEWTNLDLNPSLLHLKIINCLEYQGIFLSSSCISSHLILFSKCLMDWQEELCYTTWVFVRSAMSLHLRGFAWTWFLSGTCVYSIWPCPLMSEWWCHEMRGFLGLTASC